jgi:predicted O-methyltransferase YrrM
MRTAFRFIKRRLPGNWQNTIDTYRKNRALKRANLPVVPRHETPYMTHLPVLIGLARVVPVKRVLEFGSGEYSTGAFLNNAAFPDLTELVSIEDDIEWYETVKKMFGDVPRLDLRLVPQPVADCIHDLDLSQFDLIFIDDSTGHAPRSATIREVAKYGRPNNVVVIHDFQDQPYRDAAETFQNVFYFNHFNPTVGAVWNERPLKISRLKRINHLLYNNKQTPPNDLASWITVFSHAQSPSWANLIKKSP